MAITVGVSERKSEKKRENLPQLGGHLDDSSLVRLRGEEVRYAKFLRRMSVRAFSSNGLLELALIFQETVKDRGKKSKVRVG